MEQPVQRVGLRQHFYPDGEYGDTPVLAVPGADPAASNAARLMVRLGVDGRGPGVDPASPAELAAAGSRLRAMRLAAAATGFMVDVRLARANGADAVRAHYTYTVPRVGLLVADRPPRTSGRMFNLWWVLGDDGVYEPQVPKHVDGEYDYLEACARAYDRLEAAVVGSEADRLEVVRARLVTYQPVPQSV